MKHKKIKLFLMIGLLWAAQFASARQFYLMTVEPGSEFWSVYGHTALVIDNQVYGFGVFSFEQEDFYQSFIRNEMTYMVGHTELSDEVYWAETDGRKLTLLPLNLSEEAQDDIIAYLRWHFKPENETYAYDYFLQNCATKIRDLLDRAMSGDLKKISSTQSGSYFAQTFPVENQSLMTFGLALGYGHAAYQPRSDWELMAFPMSLRRSLLYSEMDRWHGPMEVLVDKHNTNVWLQFIKTHLFLMVVTVAALLLLFLSPTRRVAIKMWLTVQTLIGFALLFMWLGTAHEMAAWNVQLLLFSPMAALAWRFSFFRSMLWLFALLWWPLALWQGSWYLWPLALTNIWVLILLGRRSTI